jgi:exopolysaccharide production protein ExoZ
MLTINKKTTIELPKKLGLIQALRGLAAIIVVCYHTGTLYSKNLNWVVFGNAFKFGHVGVDVFFVISGFIIYYIHHKDIGQPAKIYSFIYKRFTRIYPLYWIVLLFKLLIKPTDVLTILIAFCMFPIRHAFINVSWTLSYEIFFYLCFGIFILKFNKYTKIILCLFLGSICLKAILASMKIELNFGEFYFSFLSSAYIIEFSLGILAGYLVLNNSLLEWRYWLFFGGIILFSTSSLITVSLVNDIANEINAVSFAQAERISCYLESNFLFFFGFPSLLIITGAALIDLNDKVKVPHFLLKIGDASYSIYLIHAMILNIITLKLKPINKEYLNYTVIPVIATAMFAGYLIHILIEKRMMNFFHSKYVKFTKKSKL